MSGYNIAIIGGGPSGSTLGVLLKTYNPDLRVVIFEREVFPRDHIGESLLPPISPILVEMGCWDAIEAAEFPIKIGATLKWGKQPELWNFEFFPADRFVDEPRPSRFEGQRRLTAFQVDRAIYDQILLDRAAELGCEVREECQVRRVQSQGDRVTELELETGEKVTATHYVDASGNSGILRRSVGVSVESSSLLKNIAIFDYWQNADWAVNIGVGATRIQVRSLGYGWLWFIPIGPTRTSIGLVVPAEHFKEMGMSAEVLYEKAIRDEVDISALLVNAESEGKLQTTKDWSYLAERQAGENWFLVGECGGFADPILSAGVTMAQIGAQQLAYTILEIERGKLDPVWLKKMYEERQMRRIKTHIDFGEYWYTANAQFKDLKDFTAELAKSNGLELEPDKAWAWLAQGGFIDEDLTVGVGGFSLVGVRSSTEFLTDLETGSPLEENNVLTLDLAGASWRDAAIYVPGGVKKGGSYIRDGKILPVNGHFEILVNFLQREGRLPVIVQQMAAMVETQGDDPEVMMFLSMLPEALEGMIRDGWVKASYDDRLPLSQLISDRTGFHLNTDTMQTL
jgi:flavin-dependent dehydrogenase